MRQHLYPWALSFTCLARLLSANAIVATTYHVAPPPLGNDTNPGTGAEPWATLSKVASTVGPGDVVVVASGSYAGVQFTTSGLSGSPIVLMAASGATPLIVSDNPSTPDGINLEGASYWVIDGFTVNGRTRAGIRAVLCDHVTLRNNTTDQNGRWGIFTGFCDDLLIENNETSRSFDEHGIYVSNSGDRPILRGNVSWGNNANGIHMNGDASQGGDGVISDAIIEQNILYDNGTGGGSGINMDGVQDSIIRNNLIYDTHASGISLYRIDGGGPSTGNLVANNTVHVASDGRWGLNIRDASTGNTVRNNFFYSDQSFRGAMTVDADCLAGFTSNHNIVEDRFTTDDGNTVLTLAEWRTLTGQDMDSSVGSPAALFVSPVTGDYHPLDGSAVLDAGETLADVTDDRDGTPRPLGTAYDVGAYEGTGVVFIDGFESGDVTRWSSSL